LVSDGGHWVATVEQYVNSSGHPVTTSRGQIVGNTIISVTGIVASIGDTTSVSARLNAPVKNSGKMNRKQIIAFDFILIPPL
jgi:hypothetical protein